MKKVNCTLSVVCCVSLVSMAIVMFVLYAQLLGEYQQLQHQYASISSQLNQTHDSTMIAELKVELTNLITNQKAQPNQTHDNKMIAELKTELTSLKDELDRSNKTIAELKADLTSYKVTSSDAISQLQQQDIRFSDGLNQSNKRIDELKVQLTNLNETQELLKKSFSSGQSCQEILANGKTRNGVYTITGTGTPFEAYCKQGFMVFQRRFDGSTDFNQNFQTYVNGFGSVTGEYWLGLEKLYQFTKTGKHQLRVDLVAYDGDTAYAIYDDFSIGVGPGYQLHIGKYSGTAGDSLAYHNNMKFTTVDHDADFWSGVNCADQRKGAFWYKGCQIVNINSFNYKGTGDKGMMWGHFKGGKPNKETTMMVL